MAPGMLGLIALLGACVGLDFVSFPQAMLSRPIVASTLAGWLVGNAAAGLVAGVVLETFALETMPFGASRYPEWGPAAVTAGVLAALPVAAGVGAAHTVLLAILAGLVTANLAGRTLVWLRKRNAAGMAHRRDAIAAGDATAIASLQWSGMALDFLRAGFVTAVFVAVLVPLRDAVLDVAQGVGGVALALVATLAAGVGGGATWKVVHNTKGHGWWLLAGAIVGAAVLVSR